MKEANNYDIYKSDVKKISMNDVDKCVNVSFTDGKEYSVPYSFMIDDLVDHVNIDNRQESG